MRQSDRKTITEVNIMTYSEPGWQSTHLYFDVIDSLSSSNDWSTNQWWECKLRKVRSWRTSVTTLDKLWARSPSWVTGNSLFASEIIYLLQFHCHRQWSSFLRRQPWLTSQVEWILTNNGWCTTTTINSTKQMGEAVLMRHPIKGTETPSRVALKTYSGDSLWRVSQKFSGDDFRVSMTCVQSMVI